MCTLWRWQPPAGTRANSLFAELHPHARGPRKLANGRERTSERTRALHTETRARTRMYTQDNEGTRLSLSFSLALAVPASAECSDAPSTGALHRLICARARGRVCVYAMHYTVGSFQVAPRWPANFPRAERSFHAEPQQTRRERVIASAPVSWRRWRRRRTCPSLSSSSSSLRAHDRGSSGSPPPLSPLRHDSPAHTHSLSSPVPRPPAFLERARGGALPPPNTRPAD